MLVMRHLLLLFCFLLKGQTTNEEPLKQELSAAVEDKDDSEGQDLMSMGLDDADLAEETEDDDKNLMEQGDDESYEMQFDPTAQGIYNIIFLIIAANINFDVYCLFCRFTGRACRYFYQCGACRRGLHAQTFYYINKLLTFSPSPKM